MDVLMIFFLNVGAKECEISSPNMHGVMLNMSVEHVDEKEDSEELLVKSFEIVFIVNFFESELTE